MSAIYDNWERLVDVVLRREHDREIAFCSSRDFSSRNSDSSGFEIESSSRTFFLHEESVSYGKGSVSKLKSSDFTFNRGKGQEIRSLKSIRYYEQISTLTMDFSDLTLHRDKWKEMLDPGDRQLLWPSSFIIFIDDRTGNNCVLLAATRGGLGSDWTTEVHSNNRFYEAAVLPAFNGFHIRCIINTYIFSASTLYAAYLVFKSDDAMLDVSFFINRNSRPPGEEKRVRVHLQKGSTMRDDGWMELGIGGFHIEETDSDTIELSVTEMSWARTKKIIIQGIEFRPLKPKITLKPKRLLFGLRKY